MPGLPELPSATATQNNVSRERETKAEKKDFHHSPFTLYMRGSCRCLQNKTSWNTLLYFSVSPPPPPLQGLQSALLATSSGAAGRGDECTPVSKTTFPLNYKLASSRSTSRLRNSRSTRGGRGHQQEKTPRWPSRFSWKTISVTEFMLMSAAPDRKWRYWCKLEFSFWPSSIPSHLKWYYLHSKLSCVRFNEQTWQFSGAYGTVTRLARKGATVGKYDQAIKLTLSSSHYFQLLKIWHMFDEKSNSGYDNGQKQQA